MTFPPPPPSAQSSIASSSDKTSSARIVRTQPSAWGIPGQQAGSRRGLTPLSTNNLTSTSSQSRRPPSSDGPSQNPAAPSPLASTFSSVLTSSSRLVGNRNTSSPSTTSPFTPFQPGSTQAQPGISSPRSRAITPSSASNVGAGGTSVNTSGGGGGSGPGGGGGTSRSTPFSPSLSGTNISSPTAFSFDKAATVALGPSSANSSSASLSKISVAQVFLLLDSITEKEGKGKWESKAEQIRKLVDSNGMEVFSKYFRRLLIGNAPQIFPGISRNVENAGNYQLLVQEMQKVSQDPEQAQKIAETIDTSEGDIFRDFDLSTFLDHFKLDPIAKTSLALAFKAVSRPDLRTKANVILSNSTNIDFFLQSLATPESNKDLPPNIITAVLDRYAQYPPRNFGDEGKVKLIQALQIRCEKLGIDIPPEFHSAVQLLDLMGPPQGLVHALQRAGPRVTSSVDAVNDFLNSRGIEPVTERQVADALLFMLFAQNGQAYAPSVFVAALTTHSITKSLNWSSVVRAFDRKGVTIDTEKFAVLFDILFPLTLDDTPLDQLLWSGRWENIEAQFSFLKAFLSSSPTQLDISQYPDIRRAFDSTLFNDASETTKEESVLAQNSPFVSYYAVSAVLDMILNSNETWTAHQVQYFIRTILVPSLSIFTCSAFAFSKNWTPFQEKKIQHFFSMFFLKQQDGYQFALHGMWKQDREWVMQTMYAMFQQHPKVSINTLEHALEHNWMDHLLTFPNEFTLDLATLAHRRGNLDLEAWIKQAGQTEANMGNLITTFLQLKANDEIEVQRNDVQEHAWATLAVNSVYVLLEVLEDYVSHRENLLQIQRLCIQAYPRLINYGEGFDDIIEANGAETNALPEAIDKNMQELFGKMYHEELSFKEILELMRKYKTSRDPMEQDLFTCMVHGLLDEYHCYPEYPLEALTKTAVMFGGVINFRLVSGVPLKVGLGMIMDAVRDHNPDQPMYKFGVEALEQLIARLQEWQGFCSLLLQTPSLQGTEVYKKAEEVLRDRRNQTDDDGDLNGLNGLGDGFPLTNGNIDDFLSSDATAQHFKCLHVDPPLYPDLYEEPEEQVQDTVMFVLNNVTLANLDDKLKDLTGVLEAKHHQWFANYLVEQRAKTQLNYHQLYLDLISKIGNKVLWAEVLRETYVSAIRMLNAETTMTSTTERSHLGNLGIWLGSLTIAKDKPIKHKNIYFRDLLIEGYDTQRLIMVIPFTCKVLLQASKSTIFKPPNPWLMDIVALLAELYHSAELKLNQKFEIEVLVGDLKLDLKDIEPSTILRDRQQITEEMAGPTMPDNLDAFDDLSLGGLNRGIRNERFSPAAIIASIPDLESKLVYPPSSNGLVDARLRQIVQTAVQRAIAEIISPVVERSVTIASISTAQLILKDFAMEPDEERVRESAETMVKSLAGSLALVTCKEPLRMSITNSIRIMQAEYPEQPLPEGSILMCVNDNLDTACEAVEKAAEEQAIPEINRHIKDQLEARRRHRTISPDEPFIDPVIHRWAFFIPEPYRQAAGGLNAVQRAIYEEFNRHPRGPSTSHVQSASMDSNRQIADILQEPFQIPTPAEPPALPIQAPQQQQEPRMQPPPLSTPAAQPQINGYMDNAHPREKIQTLLHQIQVAARETNVEHIKDIPRSSSIWHDSEYLINYLGTSEDLAHVAAQNMSGMLFDQEESHLGVEIMVNLLFKICHLSPLVAKEIVSWLANQDTDQIFNVPVTMALLEVGLIELHRVDYTTAKAISQRKPIALTFLAEIMDRVLFSAEPLALRADFALSLDALNQWTAEDTSLTTAKEILQKLKDSGIPDVVSPSWSDKDRIRLDQMRYIFEEWLGLFKNPSTPGRLYSAFIKEMHQKQVMNTQEDSALFFRLCLDECVAVFEHEEFNGTGNLDDMFMPTDGLAKLIILLVKLQGESNGAVKANKSAYLNSIMSLLVLVLNNHHIVRGEQFNQRVFFRLFSSILCEYYDNSLNTSDQNQEMMFIFAEKFLVLQPFHFPGFVFGWLGLVAHRALLTGLLNMPDEAGWEHYCQLMQAMLSYVGELLKPANTSPVTMDLYRGVLRILLVLHHDFPEFVAENHFRLCNVIPAHCTQLRNLVLSAYPSSFQDLPDPFTAGLKVDRLEEIRKPPRISGDYLIVLQQTHLKIMLDNIFRSATVADTVVRQLVEAITTPDSKETGVLMEPLKVDVALLNAVVLYIGQQAVAAVTHKGGPTFANNSPQAHLLVKLAREFSPEARYYFLSAIANQLRYPNSHTHYFSYAILHLFGADHNDQQESDIRQQITRVLLERLNVHRPHPWGLIITLLELLKNPNYMFWELPFIKAAPEVSRMLHTLFSHINQSPQPIA